MKRMKLNNEIQATYIAMRGLESIMQSSFKNGKSENLTNLSKQLDAIKKDFWDSIHKFTNTDSNTNLTYYFDTNEVEEVKGNPTSLETVISHIEMMLRPLEDDMKDKMNVDSYISMLPISLRSLLDKYYRDNPDEKCSLKSVSNKQ